VVRLAWFEINSRAEKNGVSDGRSVWDAAFGRAIERLHIRDLRVLHASYFCGLSCIKLVCFYN
jgi:hypothetical protein